MSPSRLLATYLYLYRASQRRNRPLVATRMLVLSAMVAARMKLDYIPQFIRLLILDENPHHLLARLATMEEALEDTDFLYMLKSLQRRYPLERAEQLLSQLEWEVPEGEHPFATTEHYAAHLLDTTLEDIVERVGNTE